MFETAYTCESIGGWVVGLNIHDLDGGLLYGDVAVVGRVIVSPWDFPCNPRLRVARGTCIQLVEHCTLAQELLSKRRRQVQAVWDHHDW